MTINADFLWIFAMPILAVGLALIVYAVLLLVSEIVGWLLGQ